MVSATGKFLLTLGVETATEAASIRNQTVILLAVTIWTVTTTAILHLGKNRVFPSLCNVAFQSPSSSKPQKTLGVWVLLCLVLGHLMANLEPFPCVVLIYFSIFSLYA